VTSEAAAGAACALVWRFGATVQVRLTASTRPSAGDTRRSAAPIATFLRGGAPSPGCRARRREASIVAAAARFSSSPIDARDPRI